MLCRHSAEILLGRLIVTLPLSGAQKQPLPCSLDSSHFLLVRFHKSSPYCSGELHRTSNFCCRLSLYLWSSSCFIAQLCIKISQILHIAFGVYLFGGGRVVFHISSICHSKVSPNNSKLPKRIPKFQKKKKIVELNHWESRSISIFSFKNVFITSYPMRLFR